MAAGEDESALRILPQVRSRWVETNAESAFREGRTELFPAAKQRSSLTFLSSCSNTLSQRQSCRISQTHMEKCLCKSKKYEDFRFMLQQKDSTSFTRLVGEYARVLFLISVDFYSRLRSSLALRC